MASNRVYDEMVKEENLRECWMYHSPQSVEGIEGLYTAPSKRFLTPDALMVISRGRRERYSNKRGERVCRGDKVRPLLGPESTSITWTGHLLVRERG
jgi:hypothetical protein